MGNKRVVTTTSEEIEQSNGDPAYVALKNFFEGMDIPQEILENYEFDFKVQRLGRTGQAIMGVSCRTGDPEKLSETILDECGPGKYNIYAKYRKHDGKEWKVCAVRGVSISDPEAMENAGFQTPGMVPVPAQQDTNLLALVFNSMMESNKLMVTMMQENSKQQTAVLTALLSKDNGGNAEMLEAIRTGAALAGAGAEGPGEEEDPMDKLINFGAQAFELIRKGADADQLKTLADNAHLDPSKIPGQS